MTMKIDIHSNNETTCIADYFIPCKNEKILNYEDACKFGEGTFKTKLEVQFTKYLLIIIQREHKALWSNSKN